MDIASNYVSGANFEFYSPFNPGTQTDFHFFKDIETAWLVVLNNSSLSLDKKYFSLLDLYHKNREFFDQKFQKIWQDEELKPSEKFAQVKQLFDDFSELADKMAAEFESLGFAKPPEVFAEILKRLQAMGHKLSDLYARYTAFLSLPPEERMQKIQELVSKLQEEKQELDDLMQQLDRYFSSSPVELSNWDSAHLQAGLDALDKMIRKMEENLKVPQQFVMRPFGL